MASEMNFGPGGGRRATMTTRQLGSTTAGALMPVLSTPQAPRPAARAAILTFRNSWTFRKSFPALEIATGLAPVGVIASVP
jgi:hypothetical protein